MGLPGEWEHPRLWQAIEQVAQAARRHQTNWAILPPNLEYARRCVSMGCRMLSLGLDVWAVWQGIARFQQDFAEFFRSGT
jgi:2-keto-3-deoxy-L-rhamnonate aldolase RhmA